MNDLVLEGQELCCDVKEPDGGRLAILKNVSVSVAAGEQLAIVGKSGSGKTTLLSILGLMARPTSGRLSLCGVDVLRMREKQLARLRLNNVGFVFQSYSLVPHLNVYENVALPLRYGPIVPRRAERRVVCDLLEQVELPNKLRVRPRALSGGEQQRVAIARALARLPRAILADEPTGALDTETGEMVLNLLKSISEYRRASLVVVTHDPDIAGKMSRKLTLQGGLMVAGARDA